MIISRFLVLVWIASCVAGYAQFSSSGKEFVGEEVRILDNSKDIYHPDNDFVREDMQKSAILDAVERGVFIKIRGGNSMFREAFNRNATESSFENYISTLLQQYNLKWKRNSDFDFTLQDKRKWKVTVRGTIDEVADSSTQNIQWDNSSIYEGKSIKVISNNSDIYDSKNDLVRKQMKQAAIFDAIEKMVNVDISGQNKSVQNAVTFNKGENISEDYVSSLLEKYQIMWKRVSTYKFEKLDKKKWAVKVSGIVVNAPKEVWGKDDGFENQKTFIVESKKFDVVRLNVGYKDVLYAQKQLIIYSNKQQKKISGGTELVRKPKAFLQIIKQDEFLATAKVIKGSWRVRVRDVAELDYFNLVRQGIKYELSLSNDLFMSILNKDALVARNVQGHAFSYFHQNELNHVGWTIGYKLQIFNFSDTAKGYAHIPNFGIYYNWNLIPDVLFLSPEFNVGFLLVGIGQQSSLSAAKVQADVGNQSINLEGKLSLGFKIGVLDLLAGYSYQHVFSTGGNPLSGLYPFIGIKVHLGKYK